MRTNYLVDQHFTSVLGPLSRLLRTLTVVVCPPETFRDVYATMHERKEDLSLQISGTAMSRHAVEFSSYQ